MLHEVFDLSTKRGPLVNGYLKRVVPRRDSFACLRPHCPLSSPLKAMSPEGSPTSMSSLSLAIVAPEESIPLRFIRKGQFAVGLGVMAK